VFEIGSSLREARLRRDLELADVEQATRIRSGQLLALEEDRFDLFSAPFYARSFLRAYAIFLGLDAQLFVDEYNARFPEPEPVAPRRAGGWRRPPQASAQKAAVLLGACILVALVALLAFRSAGRHPKAVARSPAPPPRAAHRVPARSPSPVAVRRRKPALARVVLTAAHGECWLSVRVGSATGRLLYEGTLSQGGSRRFASRLLWIRTGAPWNLSIRLNERLVNGLPTAPGPPLNLLATPKRIRPA
jgi:cytoskeleton protein RodZ